MKKMLFIMGIVLTVSIAMASPMWVVAEVFTETW